MRILITGICGFVGSTLACGLREDWPTWEIVGVESRLSIGSEMNCLLLRQLIDWRAARLDQTRIASDKTTRPFDVPWLVRDSTLASQTWDWRPQTSLEMIWVEIADHAAKNPDWLYAIMD